MAACSKFWGTPRPSLKRTRISYWAAGFPASAADLSVKLPIALGRLSAMTGVSWGAAAPPCGFVCVAGSAPVTSFLRATEGGRAGALVGVGALVAAPPPSAIGAIAVAALAVLAGRRPLDAVSGTSGAGETGGW